MDHLKPLFNPRLLADARRELPIALDDEQRAIVARWAAGGAAWPGGPLAGQKEKPLQGQFLAEVFDRLLGWRQPVADGALHHLEAETSSRAVPGYRPPDARLGWFGTGAGPDPAAAWDQTRAVLELKAPGADLDARQGAGYGRLTPVEQAFGYAAKVDGCRWVLVSNFLELRLYRTDRGQGWCQRLRLADLVDPERLADWLFLLSRTTLLGPAPGADSPVERLANQTHVEEARITKAFYVFYRDLRLDLFHQLRQDNPAPPGTDPAVHGSQLLALAQKLLDRCLFICFCEDTRLLPADVLTRALTASPAAFVPVTRWQQLCGLFAAVDRGHPALRINAYNGGLFAPDPALEALHVSDTSLDGIARLAGYDFETDLNVNILGQIFEQSITDLEAIRAGLRGAAPDPAQSRRKRDGIYYTPEHITRYMVARTIGGWLAERHAEHEARHRTGRPGPLSTETRLRIALDDLAVLGDIKVLDPACGSGAFLVAALEYLSGAYERINRDIAALRDTPAQRGLFDLDRLILQQNLFGVDLNAESVELTRLGLWLKTARPDRPLNNLDANIRCGNSLVEPPPADAPAALHEAFAALPADTRPFDWQGAFPAVFARGGFDIVLGNPPYVRQETLGPLKPWLAARFASWHGMADLYVYFYERGLDLLAPGGRLSYIVTNKWLRAGYGEPLRRLFARRAVVEELLDFGHAPIFEDADTFPCILAARPAAAPAADGGEPQVHICPVPRGRDAGLSLDNYVHEHGYPVPWSRYGADPWSLEPPAVDALMARLRERGVPLAEFIGARPLYGIKTGLNEAFLIDAATRAALIRDDPACVALIKPYLRGQDIKRWVPAWQGLWMIVLRSSAAHPWPWAAAGDQAEAVFARRYPSLHAHLLPLRERLMARQDQGRYWWELRACDYYDAFEAPKLLYQEIQFHPQYCLSDGPMYCNNKVFLLPTADLYLLAVLNSPLLWWFNWRHLPHMKDEALTPAGFRMESVPIPDPDSATRAEVEAHVDALLGLTRAHQQETGELLTWLRVEHGIAEPGTRLPGFADLTTDEFLGEVRRRRPRGAARLSPKVLTAVGDTHRHYATDAQARAAAMRALERRLSDLVIAAFGLSDDERDLLWRTAPPRMPGGGP